MLDPDGPQTIQAWLEGLTPRERLKMGYCITASCPNASLAGSRYCDEHDLAHPFGETLPDPDADPALD